MYGLPKDFDAKVFVGKKLQGVCFTTNTVQFRFDESVLIDLQSAFVFRRHADDSGQKHDVPVRSSEVMHLLGKTVASAAAKRDGTLRLVFEDRSILELFDDSKQYESYIMRVGDREIVV